MNKLICIYCKQLISDDFIAYYIDEGPVCYDCDYFDSSLNADSFDPNCDFDLGAY